MSEPFSLDALLMQIGAVPDAELVHRLREVLAARPIPAELPDEEAYARLRRRLEPRRETPPSGPPPRRWLAVVDLSLSASRVGVLSVENVAAVTLDVSLSTRHAASLIPTDLRLDPGASGEVEVVAHGSGDDSEPWAIELRTGDRLEAIVGVTCLPGAGVARVEVGGTEARALRLLQAIQAAVLTQPAAAQAVYSGLVAEGRRYGATPEGAAWRERLSRSSVVRRARLVFEASTLWMLEADAGAVTPSTYVDAVFMAAAREDLELLLDALAQGRAGSSR